MKTTTTTFGHLPDGREVKLFRFESKKGLIVSITNYGGIITSILSPDRDGTLGEITAGFPDLDSYLRPHPHFGVIVGRFANRIAKGRFSIGEKEYELSLNDPPNHLHGGDGGFHGKLWEYALVENPDSTNLILSYNSPHMEEGYPGNLKAFVVYTLNDENEIIITFLAETDADTHVNLTSHSYFNLGGFKDTIFDHQLMVNAKHHLELDNTQIPTGKMLPCKGSSFDFTSPLLNKVSHPMDNCFVLDPEREKEDPSAILYHEGTGRKLTVYSTQPGIQVYTSNFLDGSLTGHNETAYQKHQAICLETQHFPDTPNHENFPSTLLKPGEPYWQKTRLLIE